MELADLARARAVSGWLRSPLLHFLALGALLVAALRLGGEARALPPPPVRIAAEARDAWATGFVRSFGRAPTREDLSGTWVGFAEGSANFFRLQLDAAGSGTCARTVRGSGQDEVQTYRVDSWTLERTKIRIELSPLTANLPTLRAVGKAGRRELIIEFKRKGSSRPSAVHLYREDYLDEVRALLREATGADGR